MSTLRRLIAVAVTTLAVCAGALVAAAPAWAAAGVTVSGPDGSATVSPDAETAVTVSGSGFQAIQNGFGGIYVLFGWVDDASGGSWKPSRGGLVGDDYRYVPDSEALDNAGYQKFIAFAGSSTESSAQGVLAADGSWSISMNIPGATFESHDRDGKVSGVDCRQVTCGVITIGAHGVKNANNETFTPVAFAGAAAAPTTGPVTTDAAPAAAGAVRVGVESATVKAGTSVVFTGQGFIPGEQVVASLDKGLTAVGPLTAGAQGEVAAALPVPLDLRDGTHLVTLRGAGSGAVAETEITVSGGIVAAAATQPETPAWVLVVLLAAIALSFVLVVTSVVTAIVRASKRRRARRAAAAAAAAPAADPAAIPAADQAPDSVPAPVPAPEDATAVIPQAETAGAAR
jgi:hypothetical protein